MSVGARTSIVATIITLIFGPGGDPPKVGKPITIRCVAGEPIPATQRAVKLGVDGMTCTRRIWRRVYIAPKP